MNFHNFISNPIQKSSVLSEIISSILSYICYVIILSSIQKCLQLLFQLYSNCVFMPTLVSENFLRKSSILSVFLCNPQFYHTYVRLKTVVVPENISTSFSIMWYFYLYAYHCIWVFFQKIFNFINYPKYSSILSHIC